MKQHKWHKEIKAWADGAEIEGKSPSRGIINWQIENNPDWLNTEVEYRIKPQPKEPQYLYVCYNIDTEEYVLGERGKTLLGRWITKGKIKLETEE